MIDGRRAASGTWIARAVRARWLVFFGAAVLAYGNMLAAAPFVAFARDWKQFDSFRLFERSAVLGYGTLPWYDPWFCGGLYHLSNPQNRVFSPMFLLDLVAPPNWANLLSLVLYAVVGQAGMYRLLTGHFGAGPAASLITAVLFVCASWFGLHYGEGHIVFGAFQVLPWVAVAAFRFDRSGWIVAWFAMMSLFLLDGAIYCFIFSIAWTVNMWLLRSGGLRRALHDVLTHKAVIAGSIVMSVLLTAPKTVPVVLEHHDRTPVLQEQPLTAARLAESLFYPFHRPGQPGGIHARHEWCSYLGLVPLAVVAAALLRRRLSWRTQIGLLASMAFWLFVAGGWLPAINPWNAVFQKLPLFNNAHVQSRVLILFHVLWLILVARALATLDLRRRSQILVVGAAVVEAFVVRLYPASALIDRSEREKLKPVGYQLITNRDLVETVPGSPSYRPPSHYFSGNKGSSRCYEPTFRHKIARAKGDAIYQGELWFREGSGVVRFRDLTPNTMHIVYNARQQPSIVQVNQNDVPHWHVVGGEGRILDDPASLLTVQVDRKNGELKLAFWPAYAEAMLAAYGAGWVLLCVLAWRYGWARSGGGHEDGSVATDRA